MATWKNRNSKLLANIEEELNQLYLRWAGSNAANKEAVVNTMKTSTAKLLSDLGKVEMNIAKKTLLDPTPLSPTSSSNPPLKTHAFKKRDPPKFSGEARDYPKFKRLWKAVEEQFSETHQLHMIQENVPGRWRPRSRPARQ